MEKILIVVDMQNDFITGALGTKEAQAIVPAVKAKIDEYVNQERLVVFTRDTHGKDYLETQEGKYLPVPHCIIGTDGFNIINEIIPRYDFKNRIMNKASFGALDWANVIEPEDGDEIEIIGVCTDICVVSNALILKAMFPETKITIDANCCAGVTPEKHLAALEILRSCQVNVIGG